MAAEIISFPTVAEAARRDLRRLLEKTNLSHEAAEWIHADVWPRLCAVWNVDLGICEKCRNEVTLQILRMEVELYEAKFGKWAGR